MCSNVACAPVQRAAAIRDHSTRRLLCANLAFGRSREIEYDGDGCGLARICAALHRHAASILAQQWLAEEESVVRERSPSLSAKARAAVVGGVILLVACAPQIARE